jgi:hypothetical protein
VLCDCLNSGAKKIAPEAFFSSGPLSLPSSLLVAFWPWFPGLALLLCVVCFVVLCVVLCVCVVLLLALVGLVPPVPSAPLFPSCSLVGRESIFSLLSSPAWVFLPSVGFGSLGPLLVPPSAGCGGAAVVLGCGWGCRVFLLFFLQLLIMFMIFFC